MSMNQSTPPKMKSAEEWQNAFGRYPVDQKAEAEIFALARLPESVLPPVSFWNSILTENDIRQIQLDAYRAGMTEAAEIARLARRKRRSPFDLITASAATKTINDL